MTLCCKDNVQGLFPVITNLNEEPLIRFKGIPVCPPKHRMKTTEYGTRDLLSIDKTSNVFIYNLAFMTRFADCQKLRLIIKGGKNQA